MCCQVSIYLVVVYSPTVRYCLVIKELTYSLDKTIIVFQKYFTPMFFLHSVLLFASQLLLGYMYE